MLNQNEAFQKRNRKKQNKGDQTNTNSEITSEQVEKARSKAECSCAFLSYYPKRKNHGENVIQTYIEIAEKVKKLESQNSEPLRKEDKITQNFLLLPKELRRILFYKRQEGMTWKEVAKNTGYSISHCKRLEKKGLEILKQLI